MSNITRAYVRRDAARRLLSERSPDFVKLFAAPLYEDDVEVIVTLGPPGAHRRLTPYGGPDCVYPQAPVRRVPSEPPRDQP